MTDEKPSRHMSLNLCAGVYEQQITGPSATFALPFDPYSIVCMEAVHFWDARVFIPQVIANPRDLNMLALESPKGAMRLRMCQAVVG